jgi:hypothetical protein
MGEKTTSAFVLFIHTSLSIGLHHHDVKNYCSLKEYGLLWSTRLFWGRDIVVGIAASYGLDSPGFESREGEETFCFSKYRPDGLWNPSTLLLYGYPE